MSYLGLDIGTTGCKAVVFSENGQALSKAYRDYGLANPHPGFWELDAEEVWQKTRQVIREAAAASASDPVIAMAVSAPGEALVAVDHKGIPLAGAPVSADFELKMRLKNLSPSLAGHVSMKSQANLQRLSTVCRK